MLGPALTTDLLQPHTCPLHTRTPPHSRARVHCRAHASQRAAQESQPEAVQEGSRRGLLAASAALALLSSVPQADAAPDLVQYKPDGQKTPVGSPAATSRADAQPDSHQTGVLCLCSRCALGSYPRPTATPSPFRPAGRSRRLPTSSLATSACPDVMSHGQRPSSQTQRRANARYACAGANAHSSAASGASMTDLLDGGAAAGVSTEAADQQGKRHTGADRQPQQAARLHRPLHHWQAPLPASWQQAHRADFCK